MPEVKELNGFRLTVGEVSTLTFNRPINIFSSAVLDEFAGAISSLYGKAKVLLITAEGSTFMAGADIREMSGFTPDEAAVFARLFRRAMDTVEGFPGPVIAAVNGFALGGGCELILACDLAVAAESAVFGTPEINLGIIPGGGGAKRLPDRIGRLKSRELIFTGKRIGADEAFKIGLINKVVPRGKLMDEAMGLANSIAAKPRQCLEAAKSLINSGSLEKEIGLWSGLFAFDEQKRLMEEFLAKKGS
ncbi:MAG: enoyl-CoA hydratase/isomerase family protein [Deltaproteobacteria bacterium]|nr:enoyl-CoA hydratase/isomerase family protein [Deltaproteobacteria bacterium]